MSKLIVFRGLPGAGKSTMARRMQRHYIDTGLTTALYEADMYFTDKDGNYKFDGRMLPHAHAWCRNKVLEALGNCDVVIVANTNLSLDEMNDWKLMADNLGASMDVFHLKTQYGNIHGVPTETLERMKAREVDYPGEIPIEPAAIEQVG